MIRRWLARFSTLRWRLTLFYCGLLALLLAAVGISVYVRFGDALKSNVSSRLHDLAMVLTPPLNITSKLQGSNLLDIAKANSALLEYIQGQLVQTESSAAVYIGVMDSSGNLLLDNQPLKDPSGIITMNPQFQPLLDLNSAKAGTVQEYETTLDETIDDRLGVQKVASQVHGIAYVIPLLPVSSDDLSLARSADKDVTPSMYLALAAPLDGVDGALQQIAFILATGLLAALALALLLGLPIARLGLRPLRRMASTATQIGAGDLSRRVGIPSRSVASVEAGDEVQQLGQAFNAMLDRIEASFQAQKSSEARTRQFAADASHEMRSPLTVLGGYIDVLLMGAKDDPAQAERILGAMQRENDRLGRLVADLLLLTRMDANGTARHMMDPLPLKDLVMRAVDNMRMVAGSRMVQAAIAEDVEDAVVLGDGDRLYRMLTNLLDNAIRYTEPQGHIVVSLRHSDRGDGWVSLRVADDGCGIEADKLPRIFDRFYRADKSRARQTGNSGLGLSICKSIVNSHSGSICVESDRGCGTVFTVDLPLLNDSQRTLSTVSGDSKSVLLH